MKNNRRRQRKKQVAVNSPSDGLVSASTSQPTGGTLTLRLCDICESSSGSDASTSYPSANTSSSSVCAGEGCQTNIKTAKSQVCLSPHLHNASRTALRSQRDMLEEREGVRGVTATCTSPLPPIRAPQSQLKQDSCSSPTGPSTNNP